MSSVAHSGAPSSSASVVWRRSAWSLADQGVASVLTFVVALWVAREASLPQIGAFAIAFAFYQLLIAVGRPVTSDPLTIGFSSAGRAEQRAPSATATGAALALGAAILPVAALVGLAVGGPTGGALIACAVFAPAFLLQDAWRYVFFTRGTPALSFASDAAALLALVPLVIAFEQLLGSTGAAFVAAWGAAMAAGTAVSLLYGRLLPAVSSALGWLRQTAHLARHMLGENLLTMGSYLVALSIIAAAAGSDELGRLRVAQVALAPANFVTLALGTIMLAEGSRRFTRGSRAVWRLALATVAAAVGVSAVLAVGWLALPTETGTRIMGPAWSAAQSLILPVALYFGGIGLTAILSMALRAQRATREAFICRACAVPLTLVAALGGSLLDDVGLAILAMGAVELSCATAMIQRLRRLRRA